ncbi:MAG: gamma-glutamyltransferase [Alphaproteobacteria bacterium]|nr:gamma-glutamyltransferase [Alphaproteobacteria bacterium]
MLLLLALACRHPTPVQPVGPAPVPDTQPEAANACRAGLRPVHASRAMVVSAHPEASRIGAEILRRGGSAADAAAAVAIALTLVEPQSSGIGGGAFLLHHDGPTKTLTAWDGRETAPATAGPDLFVGEDGKGRPWPQVVPGGLSVGTPGLLRLLEALHAEQGKLAWAELIAPTIALAEEGFTVTPRMATSIAQVERTPMDPLRREEATRAYFYPGGRALAAGDHLRNPALAATLRAVAAGGADAFYTGPIAEHLVAAVHDASVNPGRLEPSDLASYRPVRREPVCLDYRGHRVCGHPPPTSGGTTVLSILGALEPFDLAGMPVDGVAATHLEVEATRLAWADREAYLADPAYVGVPVDAMLADDYLASRGALMSVDARLATVAAGELPLPVASGALCPEGRDTTQIVVVDGDGDVVSMTSSIENAFGSGLFVDGFLLNNQLTDFARDPVDEGGHPVANAVAACKRPRSSMAPTIVLDADGEVELALGSPGGSRIIGYVARVLVDVLDHGLDVQAAVSRPNLAVTGAVELEDDCGEPAWPAETVAGLEGLGHTVKRGSLNSGLAAIQRVDDGWLGAVDPRREGEAVPVD